VERGDAKDQHKVWLCQNDDLRLGDLLAAELYDGSPEWIAAAPFPLKVQLFRQWACEKRVVDARDMERGSEFFVTREKLFENLQEAIQDKLREEGPQFWFKRFVFSIENENNPEEDFGGVSRALMCNELVKQIFAEDRKWFRLCETEHSSYQVVDMISWWREKAILRVFLLHFNCREHVAQWRAASNGAQATQQPSYPLNQTSPLAFRHCDKAAPQHLDQVSQERVHSLRLVGQLLGKMLLEGFPVSAHLSGLMFKHLIGAPHETNDLYSLNAALYENLSKLQEMPDVDCLDLVMEASIATPFGDVIERDLKTHGEMVKVTDENKAEYVELYEEVLIGLAEPERKILAEGFHEIVPAAWLAVFSRKELELLMCGSPQIDIEDWIEHTVYSGRYVTRKSETGQVMPGTGADHPIIRAFWEVVRSFSPEQHAKLLQFCTGTASLPVEGFDGLQSKAGAKHPFHITSIRTEDCSLPRAHTCFNKLDLPMYDTAEEIYDSLSLVIELDCGFGMGT